MAGETYLVDFSNYESAAFATIPESIDHSITNELLISNLSNKLIYNRNDKEEVTIQDPSCTFKEMIKFYNDKLVRLEIPDNEFFRPEMTAKRVYNNADFWSFILIANNMNSVIQFNKREIMYIPGNVLITLTFFRNMHKNERRVVEMDSSSSQFLTK